jgi:hypothetical protein
MYADTIFKWEDQSAITPVEIAVADTTPLFPAVFSSDRGPEEMKVVKGDEFKIYADLDSISFAKHGQPLLQAANIIKNGGKLLCKRVVAPDSALANIIIYAKVAQKTKQKLNSDGKPLYVQADNTEGITVTETPVNVSYASIKYGVTSVEHASSFDAVYAFTGDASIYDKVGKLVDGATTFMYPIGVYTENGRGTSTKKIKITPDYVTSKNLSFVMQNITVMSGTTDLEMSRFAPAIDIVYGNESYSLTNMARKYMKHIKAKVDEVKMKEFIEKVAELSNMSFDELNKEDVIFGKTRKGVAIPNIEVDTVNGLDLSSEFGIDLLNGENGTFGEKPFGTEACTQEMVKFFNGTFSDDIYDLNTYKIAAMFDANYPEPVKHEAELWMDWRKDGTFFRDGGLNIYSYESAADVMNKVTKSRYVAPLFTTYDIVDPYSRRVVNVTAMYDLSVIAINHIEKRAHYPMAGIANGIILKSAIEGTVNFIPKVTNKINQKTLMEELRLNYAGWVNGQLVVETQYNTQPDYTEWSFINNVLATQEVARAVRTACPTNRYKFIVGTDLETYKKAVDEVIAPFSGNFATLEFVYTQDPIMVSNKIFNAGIKFGFKPYEQTEIITLYAIPFTV